MELTFKEMLARFKARYPDDIEPDPLQAVGVVLMAATQIGTDPLKLVKFTGYSFPFVQADFRFEFAV
jgi:hypothetical protein